jgi:hypothetical protein
MLAKHDAIKHPCYEAPGLHDEHSTCGLVAMTSASHAEGRQFDPGQVYLLFMKLILVGKGALLPPAPDTK